MNARRLKIIVAYDGSSFAGWQSQKQGGTIQDHLERAIQKIAGTPLRVHGAGRTDAGVHALAQCAHVDVPDRGLTSGQWLSAINGSLPAEIRVMRTSFVQTNFHARFSATGKIYRYRIWNEEILPPLEVNRAWHVANALDFAAIDSAAQKFLGEHDFSAFAANRGKPEKNTVRTIRSVVCRRSGKLVTLEFEGNGFLYKMVRLMAGSLVRVGLGKLTMAEIARRLAVSGGTEKETRLVAPAHGLFLLRVRY